MVHHCLSWCIMVYQIIWSSFFLNYYCSHGLSWFSWLIIAYHGISWFITVYVLLIHGLSWVLRICKCLSWLRHGSSFCRALSWLLTVSLGFSIAYHDGKWLQNRKGLWWWGVAMLYHASSWFIMVHHAIFSFLKSSAYVHIYIIIQYCMYIHQGTWLG